MNTADEKGSAISVAAPGKFLPQPGMLTPADLAQYLGLFRHFYFDGASSLAGAPTAVFTGIAAPIMQVRLRRY